MRRLIGLCASCVMLSALAQGAAGDQIVLSGGGKLDGKIDEQASSPTQAVIKTDSGAKIRVERSRIVQVIPRPSALEEYEKIKPQHRDTAEDQYRLAEWCRQKRLSKQRQAHLERTIQLDTNHAKARAALAQIFVGGRWLTQEEAMAQKGLVRSGNRWVLPQEKALLEEKAQQAGAQRNWYQQIRLWKTWLTGNDPGRRAEALAKLKAIDDPLAVAPLVKTLASQGEAVRELLAQLLGQIDGAEATDALVQMVLVDPSTAVRWAALDELAARKDPAAVPTLLAALRSPVNVVVRRSAEALGELEDQAAVPHLIDALVTAHEAIVRNPAPRTSFAIGNVQSLAVVSEPVVAPGVVAFRSVAVPMIGDFSMNSPAAGGKVVKVDVENNEALFSLQKLTGENFGFRKELWGQWYYARAVQPVEGSAQKYGAD